MSEGEAQQHWWDRYRSIPRPVALALLAQLLLNFTGAAQMLVFNIYLRDLGYSDPEVADLTSFRFLGILALSIPFGLCIRNWQLRPFLWIAALGLPTATVLLVSATDSGGWRELSQSLIDWGIPGARSLIEHQESFIRFLMVSWGLLHMCMQVSMLPFILRHSEPGNRSEAISLSFAAWALPLFLCGLLIRTLREVLGVDDGAILCWVAGFSLLAVPVVMLIRETARPLDRAGIGGIERRDLLALLAATTPTLLIAVGAGLTIPFISLFFYNVFGLKSDEFALLGSSTGVLVLLGFLWSPTLRRRWGYRSAILMTQGLAVLCLGILALADLFHHVEGAFAVAAVAYLLRQPLMNMANPASSELGQLYVGDRNRELLSAISSGIWSGSWYFSAKVFQALRAQDVAYSGIFLTTATVYIGGIIAYAFLIRSFERRRARGTLQTDGNAFEWATVLNRERTVRVLGNATIDKQRAQKNCSRDRGVAVAGESAPGRRTDSTSRK